MAILLEVLFQNRQCVNFHSSEAVILTTLLFLGKWQAWLCTVAWEDICRNLFKQVSNVTVRWRKHNCLLNDECKQNKNKENQKWEPEMKQYTIITLSTSWIWFSNFKMQIIFQNPQITKCIISSEQKSQGRSTYSRVNGRLTLWS